MFHHVWIKPSCWSFFGASWYKNFINACWILWNVFPYHKMRDFWCTNFLLEVELSHPSSFEVLHGTVIGAQENEIFNTIWINFNVRALYVIPFPHMRSDENITCSPQCGSMLWHIASHSCHTNDGNNTDAEPVAGIRWRWWSAWQEWVVPQREEVTSSATRSTALGQRTYLHIAPFWSTMVVAGSNKLARMLLKHVYLIVLSVEGMEITIRTVRGALKAVN